MPSVCVWGGFCYTYTHLLATRVPHGIAYQDNKQRYRLLPQKQNNSTDSNR
jgi:hypothetical protein